MSRFLRSLCPILLLSGAPLAAQVTYIDATASNLSRVDGNPFNPSTSANVYTDNNWTRREPFASHGTAYESGGGEAVPALRQSVTGIPPGTYDIHVFFWVANNVNWQISAGLTAGNTTNFRSTGTAITPAGPASLASASTYSPGAAPTVFAELDRTLIRARIGTTTIDSTGNLTVFITGSPVVNGNSTNSRTWFDGIGYSAPEPLPGNGVEISPDGAWTWFNDERAIIHRGALYCGYVRTGGTYGISRRDLTTGATTHMTISTATSQQYDDHNNPSITPLPDGRLLILYSKHIAGARFFQRTSLVPDPAANGDWGPEVIVPMPVNNTYANTYRLTGESDAIYNFSRCINFNPTLSISLDHGATWGAPRQLVGTGSGSTRPYPRYWSNNVDQIDWIYTDGHPRDVNNSVYHAYYKAGQIHRTDGTVIDSLANIPLDHDAGERGNVIYAYSAAAWGPGDGPDDWIPSARGWTWDMARGSDGHPVCVFQVQTGTDATWESSRIFYYHARWTGTAWKKKFIAQAGRGIYGAESDYGGGMCLDPDDPRVVYISTNAATPFDLSNISSVPLAANARYEIWRGFTADGGDTFSWTPITSNSTSSNYRPIVPPGHGRSEFLLWFNGTYNTYTNYSTQVLGRIGNAQTSFDSWATGAGATGGFQADTDGDGSANLIEFALGGDPDSTASNPLPVWLDNSFRFPWPAGLGRVEWHVQESDDLESPWQTVAILRTGNLPHDIGPGYTLTGAPGGTAILTPVTPPQQRFLRLKVVGNP